MFYSSMYKLASGVRRAVRMPKLLNRRKSRPLLEQLENRLCMATGAYTYSVVAATGNTVNAPGGGPVGTLTNISLASISDSGNVAFLGTVNGYNGVDEATFSNGNWSLSDLSLSSSQNYTYPQIDNNDDVIAEDHELVGSTINTYIRLWHPAGTKIDFEQASSDTGDLYVVPTISPDGTQFAWLDAQLPNQLTLYVDGVRVHTFPANSGGLQPMIANNGSVVVRDGSTTTSPIRLFHFTQTPVTIADPAYFSSIGNNPGIDAAGNVVTFTGTLFDAASLNAANAFSISKAQILSPGYSLQVNQLTPGPGVFASVPIDTPSSGPADRVVIRLAGVSGSGYLNPGETWTGTTDVGPFSAFPDARSVPTSSLTFSNNVLTSGSINVVFMANDTTSSANQGLYDNDISIRGAGGAAIFAAVDDPIEVVNSGETITGVGQITAVNDYFPMNAQGQVVFVANTAGGQAVVQANPYTYLPPSVTNPLLYNAYKPSQIRTAYGINDIPMFTGPSGQQVTPDGTGQTIAIVDAYNDPNIIGDLTQFDSTMGVPAPPSFQVYNQAGTNVTSLIGTSGQNGVPQVDPSGGSEGEEALDVEWAHAIAPGASIILVEANSDSSANLEDTAAVWAASPASGASVVSLSYGPAEYSGETTRDMTDYEPRAGVTIVACTQDLGAPGSYPAFSPNVVAVGGTTLYLNSDNSYLSETTWGLGGGGVSQYESQPAYQNGIATPFSATQRVTPDVSFVGDARTGVLIYNSYNKTSGYWEVIGGTSLSAPCWAGLIAIANQGRVLLGKAPLSGATETLPALYSLPAADFHDVTTGNNGQYTLTTTNQALFSAGPGYDPATGLGSPVANLLIPDLVAYTSTKDIWTGKGSDNLWSDAANWSDNILPTAGEDLLFPSGAPQETSVDDLGLAFSSITTAGTYSFSVPPGQTLTTNSLNVNQGSLELACSATVSQAASVAAGASLTVDAGNTLDIQTSMVLAATGSLTVQGTVTVYSTGTLNDQGTVTVPSGGTINDPGTITVASGGTLNDSGTVTVAGGLQVTGTFELASGGVLDDQKSVTVAPSTGRLLDGGTVTVEPTASLDDQGTVDVTEQLTVGGTLKVESDALLFVEVAGTLGIFDMATVASGGTLTDQGTVTIPTGGTLTDQGTVTVSPGGSLAVDGTVSVASGAMLDDQGGVEFEDVATLDDSGTVSVDSEAQLFLYGNSTVEANGTLTDQGTVTVGAHVTLTIKGMGMVTVAADATLDDMGTVSVESTGNLDDQGTVTVETAATLVDSGTVTVATGVHLDLFGSITVGGTLVDQGAVTVGSTCDLDIPSLGSVQVASGATLDVSGLVTVENGATLNVAGTLTVEQPGLLDDKGSVTVAGTLDDLGAGANAVLVEEGASLTVSGQLIVESSTFLVIKGTVQINTGGSLDDKGTVTVEDTGLLSVQGSITVAAEATLDVMGQLTVEAGGLVDVFGTLTIEKSGTLDIFGTVIIEIGATYVPLGTVIIETGGVLRILSQPLPTIVVSTSSLALGTTTQGTAGAAQSFTVSGSNLTADIILAAPSGVDLSDNGGTSYSSTLDLVESNDTVGTTTVLARITAGAPAGPVSGMIAADSRGAAERDITVTGTVNPASVPAITVSTSSLSLGTTTEGTAGSAQSFTVSGSNLTADILLTAPSGVQLSDNGGSSYSTTLDLAESGGTVGMTTVFARITATAPVGPVSGVIAADSTGATEQDISVSGTVTAPTITVSTNSLDLGTTTQGTPGDSQSFTVSGSNLTADIILTAPTGVELSDNGGSYSSTLDLVESGGTVGSTAVLARISATAPVGPVSGVIAADSTGATEQDISVSGTVKPVPTPTITVSTSSLNLGTTTQGTAGTSQSFTVGGSNLTAEILLTAPTGVELSDNGGSSYIAALDLTESVGTVGTTTILARIAATAPLGPVSGMIRADSTGATEKDISVSGTVNPFTITAISPVSPNPRNTPVSTIDVTFSEPINLNTLTAGLTLSDNGGSNLINGAVTVSLVSGSTYQLNGLAGLTAINGEYTLTVNAASVQDTQGDTGAGSLSTMWLMDVSPPTSTVNPLPTRETSLTFPVSVTGSDQGNPAAGIAFYTIYFSTNSGPWTEWTTLPAPNTTANFTGQSNTSYSFYSIATDYASNVENKAAGTEASTYVPNLTPPVTSVDGTTGSNPSTLNSSTGTFTLNLTGNDPGGSALQYFEVYASVDGGSYQEVGPYAIPAGPADSSGNYHSMIIYQGLTDGQSHTYSFYSIGLDSAGNLQSAPSSPNVTFSNEVFTTPSQLQITGFTVEHGSPSRSFVRYLDLTFNESDSQSGGELTSIVNSISTTSPDIQVFKYNLDGSGSGTPVPLNSSPTILDVLDHAIEIDFGSGGILGTPNTTAADGYYKVVIKLPGQQPATHYFDRILGDVNGDGIVDSNDLNEIAASSNPTSQLGWTPLSTDVNGDGTVTAFDLTLATRAKGHKLGSGLQLG